MPKYKKGEEVNYNGEKTKVIDVFKVMTPETSSYIYKLEGVQDTVKEEDINK